MEPVIRPISQHEYSQALELWPAVFSVPREYFARYYDSSDPWHLEGDTLGAFVDGKLASAVHVCRRPLTWNGRTILCGGIANVATHVDYRSRKLSSQLLQRAIKHMESGKFDFSMLGTGIFGFYKIFGWEQIQMPQYTVTIGSALPASASQSASLSTPTNSPQPAVPSADAISIYGESTRPLRLARTEPYFEGWAGWEWKKNQAEIVTLPGKGYIVTNAPGDLDQPYGVFEWQALDKEAEVQLLQDAAARAKALGRKRIRFEANPQFTDPAFFASLGSVEKTTNGSYMLRNIGLPDSDFQEIKDLYESGDAAWWHSDAF